MESIWPINPEYLEVNSLGTRDYYESKGLTWIEYFINGRRIIKCGKLEEI